MAGAERGKWRAHVIMFNNIHVCNSQNQRLKEKRLSLVHSVRVLSLWLIGFISLSHVARQQQQRTYGGLSGLELKDLPSKKREKEEGVF